MKFISSSGKMNRYKEENELLDTKISIQVLQLKHEYLVKHFDDSEITLLQIRI